MINNSFWNNNLISSKLIPTDVKVYADDGELYLDYTGKIKFDDGSWLKIHIPKMSLVIDSIKQVEEHNEFGFVASYNVCVESERFFDVELLERTVTKEQLEKELGYKINIKE